MWVLVRNNKKPQKYWLSFFLYCSKFTFVIVINFKLLYREVKKVCYKWLKKDFGWGGERVMFVPFEVVDFNKKMLACKKKFMLQMVV